MGTPEIEQLLEKAAANPAAAPAFLSALLAAEILVPGVADVVGGIATAGSQASFAGLTSASGASVQPFFTSEARMQDTLRAVPGFENRFLSLRCRDLFELTRGATLVVNPHSAYGKEFLPDEITQLLSGQAAMTARVVEAETSVLVGAPATVPEGMVEALQALLQRHASVESAYLGWKVEASTQDQSYLLEIVGTATARSDVADDLGRALIHFSQSHPVDVSFVQPGGDHLLSLLEPFYERDAPKR